ncbi:MAG: hypothetical protein CVU56_25595 [Deltaproteobacteria bacterium HGW-Deltaproteobacteria-14]|jgi:hypothetical protein|nr:MAG: hypothetical protein CVU56_25595 [Deltaproteobacteria bacterium HGW-Deltaproteobacteria-14]
MRWFTPLLIVAVLPGVAPPAAAQCVPEECLHCGESFTGTTVQKTKDFSDYPCVAKPQSASDQFFCFTWADDIEVRLELDVQPPPVASMSLLVLEGACSPDACVQGVSGGYEDKSLAFIATGSTGYYFAVDGWLSGDDSPFTLSVECRAYGQCAVVNTLICGEERYDQLEGTDHFSIYPGAVHPKPGLEMVYTFVATENAKVSFDLYSPSLADTDLIVLDDACAPTSLIALAESGAATDVLTIDAVAGHTYYVVVDARKQLGTGDGFYLTTTCQPACASDADCDGATPACDTATGECVTCVSDSHCPAGERCDAHACVDDPRWCGSSAACGPGATCIASACVSACGDAAANPCAPPAVCDSASGVCVAPRQPQCVAALHCGPGEFCAANGACLAHCADPGANPCAAPRVCESASGLCQFPPECLTSAACGPGERCADGGCVDACADADANPCPAGTACDGATLACTPSSTLTTCTSSADCATDQECDPDSNTCTAAGPPNLPPAANGPGGGCAGGSTSPGGGLPAALLCLLALLAVRFRLLRA